MPTPLPGAGGLDSGGVCRLPSQPALPCRAAKGECRRSRKSPKRSTIPFLPTLHKFPTTACCDRRSDGMVAIWSVATGQVIRSYDTNGVISAISFAPDGKSVLMGFENQNPNQWYFASDKTISALAIREREGRRRIRSRRQADVSNIGVGPLTSWNLDRNDVQKVSRPPERS